jgi:hypothetical protein
MRALLGIVLRQSFWICLGYLGLGILSELLRMGGFPSGVKLQHFLDGLPIALMRLTGFIDLYVLQTATGMLTPFWNRCLLASLTLAVIFVQTMLIGGLFSAGFWALERRLMGDKRHDASQ